MPNIHDSPEAKEACDYAIKDACNMPSSKWYNPKKRSFDFTKAHIISEEDYPGKFNLEEQGFIRAFYYKYKVKDITYTGIYAFKEDAIIHA